MVYTGIVVCTRRSRRRTCTSSVRTSRSDRGPLYWMMNSSGLSETGYDTHHNYLFVVVYQRSNSSDCLRATMMSYDTICLHKFQETLYISVLPTYPKANSDLQWWIHGRAPGMCPLVQILSFSCSFRQKFCQIIGWYTLLRSWHPSWKSWIRH